MPRSVNTTEVVPTKVKQYVKKNLAMYCINSVKVASECCQFTHLHTYDSPPTFRMQPFKRRL